jgi:hypothetical protein
MVDYRTHDKDGNPLDVIDNSPIQGYVNPRKRLETDPDWFDPSPEDLKCEMQLAALDFWEPLNFKVKEKTFNEQLEQYNDKWVPYLRKEGVMNDREGMLLWGLEGDSYTDSLSMPEAIRRTGKNLKDADFKYPTELYNHLECLHPALDFFAPLGRTMLIKMNKGSFFVPHKDDPYLTRDCFRIAAFFGKVNDFEWEMCGQKVDIEPGRFYYVDTRKTHRTHSWQHSSIHLIVNIPKTWENVLKITTNLLRAP